MTAKEEASTTEAVVETIGREAATTERAEAEEVMKEEVAATEALIEAIAEIETEAREAVEETSFPHLEVAAPRCSQASSDLLPNRRCPCISASSSEQGKLTLIVNPL